MKHLYLSLTLLSFNLYSQSNVRVDFKSLSMNIKSIEKLQNDSKVGFVLHNESFSNFLFLLKKNNKAFKNLSLKSRETLSMSIDTKKNESLTLIPLSPPMEAIELIK